MFYLDRRRIEEAHNRQAVGGTAYRQRAAYIRVSETLLMCSCAGSKPK